MSLNATLATAGHSLEVFSTGIQVAGQNVSNASTPGYIREEIQLDTGYSYRNGRLVLGTGVRATGVQQQIDQFLEQRIHTANAEVSTATIKDQIYKQLEGELQELGEGDLSTAITNFFDAVQDLSTQPESVGFRDLVVQQGETLAREIQSLSGRINEIRLSKTTQVESLVTEANRLIQQIDELNQQILRLEGGGLLASDAGAARSERYQALARLSEIVPIQYREQPNGVVDVYSESDFLVLNGTTQELILVGTGEGPDGFRVELSRTGHDLARSGGELRGLVEGRDDILGGFLEQLDTLSGQLIFEFNRIHSQGSGLNPLTEIAAVYEATDPNALLNESGLPFAVEHGAFDLRVTNLQTGLSETVSIPVVVDGSGADSSLESIRAAIDATANVTATITSRGQLQISASDGFGIQLQSDSSGFLAAVGLGSFFSGTNAANIAVTERVANNSNELATGLGGGPSDGRNLEQLLAFFDQPLDGLDGLSVNEFYDRTITDLAHNSADEQALAEGFQVFRDSLANQQRQFTGVSLDEETIQILEYQRSYQSAARVISTVNELFAVLLNL